jgi:hypothetical protein
MSDMSQNPPAQQPPAQQPPTQQPFPAPPAELVIEVSGTPAVAPPVSTTRGMYTAAAILNWITLVIVVVATVGFGIIAAAWFVPMTILTHKAAKGPYKHTALAVCTLLFVNIISGILMLVDDSNRPAKPVS